MFPSCSFLVCLSFAIAGPRGAAGSSGSNDRDLRLRRDSVVVRDYVYMAVVVVRCATAKRWYSGVAVVKSTSAIGVGV